MVCFASFLVLFFPALCPWVYRLLSVNLGDLLGERVRGCFPLYRTTRTNQGKMEPKLRPNWLLGIVVRARVTYCQEKNAGKHRQSTEKPVIYLSLKTDENQKKNKLRCTAVPEPCVQLCIRRKFGSCVWSLHTLHSGVNNYIWTIRHFDYCVYWRAGAGLETEISENGTAIFDRTGKFPSGPNSSIYV